jgi:hypothetical protein
MSLGTLTQLTAIGAANRYLIGGDGGSVGCSDGGGGDDESCINKTPQQQQQQYQCVKDKCVQVGTFNVDISQPMYTNYDECIKVCGNIKN